jgi:predicted nucleic acid-binding Zn finger protein
LSTKNINARNPHHKLLQISKSNITSPKAVKVHIFRPSARRICTVVGKDDEYWTEPDLDFCSCKNYYYRSLSSGKQCYHLTSAIQFINEKTSTLLEFSDNEYDQFVRAIIQDALKNVLAS